MPVITPPPVALMEQVSDVIHGVVVSDPYRWLEDRTSAETGQWLAEQQAYMGRCVECLPGREAIRKRMREYLAVETCDSFLIAGDRYFFRKRLPSKEQASIYLRDGGRGADQLLVDPSKRGAGHYCSVKPIRVSPGGKLLLYEIKTGGERAARFELLDVQARTVLPDGLGHGYLGGFAFAPDSRSFYYVHQPSDAKRPLRRAASHHVLGTAPSEDREIFVAGDERDLRLLLVSDSMRLGFLVSRYGERTRVSFYVKPLHPDDPARCVFADEEYSFAPRLVHGKIFAVTSRRAPNLRIVELRPQADQSFEWTELIPERRSRIHQWLITRSHILVSYIWQAETRVLVYDLARQRVNEWPARTAGKSLRFLSSACDSEDVLIESESFTTPPATLRCSPGKSRFDVWASRSAPLRSDAYGHVQVWYGSKDATPIPMLLVGRKDVLRSGCHPTVMTSYGGFAVPMTARFSVFLAFLLERGCLVALPVIRGGGDFGTAWHEAARKRNRQTAIDDFLAAAEWLIAQGTRSSREACRVRRIELRLAGRRCDDPAARAVPRGCLHGSAARYATVPPVR